MLPSARITWKASQLWRRRRKAERGAVFPVCPACHPMEMADGAESCSLMHGGTQPAPEVLPPSCPSPEMSRPLSSTPLSCHNHRSSLPPLLPCQSLKLGAPIPTRLPPSFSLLAPSVLHRVRLQIECHGGNVTAHLPVRRAEFSESKYPVSGLRGEQGSPREAWSGASWAVGLSQPTLPRELVFFCGFSSRPYVIPFLCHLPYLPLDRPSSCLILGCRWRGSLVT